MQVDDNGNAILVAYFAKQHHDFLARYRVEAGNRFVGQDDLGLLRERARNADALLLAARQFVGATPGFVGQVNTAQHVLCDVHVFLAEKVEDAAHPGALRQPSCQDIGNDRESIHKIELLEDHRNSGSDAAKLFPADSLVADTHLASRRVLQSVHETKQGGLARATGTQNNGETTRCDLGVDALQGFEAVRKTL